MATVVSYRVGDDSKVVVMEGAGGLPDLQVKVLLANHLGAPDADHKGPGSNASVDELVDSRLAAVGAGGETAFGEEVESRHQNSSRSVSSWRVAFALPVPFLAGGVLSATP